MMWDAVVARIECCFFHNILRRRTTRRTRLAIVFTSNKKDRYAQPGRPPLDRVTLPCYYYYYFLAFVFFLVSLPVLLFLAQEAKRIESTTLRRCVDIHQLFEILFLFHGIQIWVTANGVVIIKSIFERLLQIHDGLRTTHNTRYGTHSRVLDHAQLRKQRKQRRRTTKNQRFTAHA